MTAFVSHSGVLTDLKDKTDFRWNNRELSATQQHDTNPTVLEVEDNICNTDLITSLHVEEEKWLTFGDGEHNANLYQSWKHGIMNTMYSSCPFDNHPQSIWSVCLKFCS